jgi:hypothetical protein
MKINNIALYANNRELAKFSFADPKGTEPYVATQVVGLDADSITPRFYGSNLSDTTPFYSPLPGLREVSFRIVLNPNFFKGEDHSILRDNLYRAISTNRTGKVQMQLRYGRSTVAAVDGSVVKFDTDHFAPIPAVNLSIRCDRPYFYSLEERIIDVTTLVAERPFSIQDTYSTAQHGFRLRLLMEEDHGSFEIRDPKGDWAFRVSGADIKSGDILYLSTISKERALYVERSGEQIYMMEFVEQDSVWPEVFPGLNTYQINGLPNHKMLSLTYYDTYWGV